jgi:hypothetical protein
VPPFIVVASLKVPVLVLGQVRQAFLQNEPSPSSKDGRSGLELSLIRNTLRRMNCSIRDDCSADGQRWIIDLPRDDNEAGEAVTSSPEFAPAWQAAARWAQLRWPIG